MVTLSVLSHLPSFVLTVVAGVFIFLLKFGCGATLPPAEGMYFKEISTSLISCFNRIKQVVVRKGMVIANRYVVSVAALRKVASSLGKNDWNFGVNPCSKSSGWITDASNNLTCDCTFSNGTVCHVTNM